jgi:hypothetical protein
VDQYTTLITALASAAVGGAVALVGVYFTNRGNTARLNAQLDHEVRRRREELLRTRGEELYELIDKWLHGLFGHYLSKAFVMQGKLTYDQALDLDLKNGKSSSGNFGRIEMLIDVYFPTLRQQYNLVISHREATNKHVIAHKLSYEKGQVDGTKFLQPFNTDQLALENAAEKLKAMIIEQVRAV